jgi:hypothetical protein
MLSPQFGINQQYHFDYEALTGMWGVELPQIVSQYKVGCQIA